ncbi:hypothetical protein LR48_Vigan05g157600 [Vigna angularis]|uniref:Uncharacterized protein n=1 Tax=Phaseolus angularis TaxID=3914 RepID=A0A0L9UMR3_PHAAN|nr:hypothetical protein LR48_Vigan05g157600 [Vigna angularis]
MSGEAIHVDRARKQRPYGFKFDSCHVKNQLRLRLPLKASTAQFKVTISSNSHPYQLNIPLVHHWFFVVNVQVLLSVVVARWFSTPDLVDQRIGFLAALSVVNPPSFVSCVFEVLLQYWFFPAKEKVLVSVVVVVRWLSLPD